MDNTRHWEVLISDYYFFLRYGNPYIFNIPQFLYQSLQIMASKFRANLRKKHEALKHHDFITLLCQEYFLNQPHGQQRWESFLENKPFKEIREPIVEPVNPSAQHNLLEENENQEN